MRLYYLILLLSTTVISASEMCVMKQHGDINAHHKGEFLLCTNSSNFGVDCAVFAVENNVPTFLLSSYIKNEDITTFTDAIASVVACIKNDHGIAIKYACFAGPGVPSAQKDYLSHMRLPYVIDAKETVATCQLNEAIIVNDFLAMSYGIDFLDKNNITTLYDVPAEPHGNRVIIGALSGLGTVSMIWDDPLQAYKSTPAEAGTGNFPAFDQFEFDLMIAMKKVRNFSTSHWAFFVSLPAIEYMHQILQDMNYENCAMGEKNKLDAMTILASADKDVCCKKTADLFYKFYARFVYNFVWTTLPFGGIYLVGETATQHPEMLSNIFLPEYFNCVESKRPSLQRIPVYIIKDDITVGLYGIAQYFLLEKKELFKVTPFFEEVREKITSVWSYIKGNILTCC
jgi:glucokinase